MPYYAKRLFGCFSVFLTVLVLSNFSKSQAATYYVSKTGNDSNAGTQASPWATIQKAASFLKYGDTAIIQPGSYSGEVVINTSGITLQAEGRVISGAFTIYGNNNTIKGFTITDPTSDWGILTRGGNYNLIENNEIYYTKQDGIWFFGSHNTFRGNYIHDILNPNGSELAHVDCFQSWGWDYGSTYNLFDRNICITNKVGAKTQQIVMLARSTEQEVRDITFTNNLFVIYQPVYSAINLAFTVNRLSNISVINNTIVNMDRTSPPRAVVGIELHNVDNATIVNNILVNFGNTSFWPNEPYATESISNQGSTGLNIHNNAYYNVDGIAPYGSTYPGDIWMKDPKFVSLTGLDFHLTSASPLINSGYNVGSSVSTDLDGTSRPQGDTYDIGALEYKSEIVTPTAKQGDANNDGLVNETDYSIWLSHYNTSGTLSSGDFNADGFIDGSDYVIWVTNYGK